MNVHGFGPAQPALLADWLSEAILPLVEVKSEMEELKESGARAGKDDVWTASEIRDEIRDGDSNLALMLSYCLKALVCILENLNKKNLKEHEKTGFSV